MHWQSQLLNLQENSNKQFNFLYLCSHCHCSIYTWGLCDSYGLYCVQLAGWGST